MSIGAEIRARIKEGRLAEFAPSPGIGRYRPVFLLPEVHSEIVSVKDADEDEVADMQFVRAELENFIGRFRVTVTFGRKPKTQFRRLSVKKGKKPKVWEIRIMDAPTPYRLLGFFADQDTFIGVELLPRESLDFEGEIKRANRKWANLFNAHEPVVSENIYDYISEHAVYFSQ